MNLVHRIFNAALLSIALTGAVQAAARTAPVSAPGSAAVSERVNINTADVATLDRVLVNVGPSKAQAIVAYRSANGPFRSVDQLALVKGIGLKTIERNRDRIMLPAVPPGGAANARAVAPRLPSRATNLQR